MKYIFDVHGLDIYQDMEYDNLGDDDFRMMMELDLTPKRGSPEYNPWKEEPEVVHDGYEAMDGHDENDGFEATAKEEEDGDQNDKESLIPKEESPEHETKEEPEEPRRSRKRKRRRRRRRRRSESRSLTSSEYRRTG